MSEIIESSYPVHDNEILSYLVDIKNKRIILYTEFEMKNLKEKTTVEFVNVVAHFFGYVLHQNIISDIYKCPVEELLEDEEYKGEIEKGKNYGWPIGYSDKSDLLEELNNQKQSCFMIDSSYGLYGWFLAEDIKITVEEIK